MPENHEYKTSLKIEGGIDAKLKDSLKEMSKQFLGIGREAKEAGEKGKHGLHEIKEGSESAKKAVEGLKEAVSELLAPVLAVTGAFMGIKGIFNILDKASDKFQEIRNSAENFRATLAGTYYLSHHPKELDRYDKKFEEIQEEAVKKNMGLWGTPLFEAEQQELVSRANLGPTISEDIVAAIPTAVARLHGGLSAVTVDSVKELADKVSLAVKTGRARGIEFGFNKEQQKAFAAMNKERRVAFILAKAEAFQGRAGYLGSLSTTEQFKLLQLRHENAVSEVALGKEWLGIHEQVEKISLEVKTVLMDLLRDVIIPLEPSIESALRSAEQGIKRVSGWLKWLFKDPSTFGTKLKKSLNDAFTAAGKTMDEHGLGWLEHGIADVHHALGDSFHTDVGLLVIALGSLKTLGLAGDLKQWLQKIGLMNVQAQVVNVIGGGGGVGVPGGGGGAAVAEAAAGSFLTWLPALSIAAMGIGAVELHRRTGLLGFTGAEPEAGHLGIGGGAASADTNPLMKSSRQVAEAAREHRDSLLDLTKETTTLTGLQEHLNVDTLPKFNVAIETVTGNDLFHFNLALDLATQKLLTLAMGAAGGAGGSGQAETQYGHVPGDQPGGPTYDYNSWHGIGSFGNLRAGDVAMHDAFARAHGFTPGSTGPDPYHPGTMVRWQDHSGASNPNNVDHYVPPMAKGGLVKQNTLAFLHKGETIVPGDKGLAMSGVGASHNFAPSITVNMSVSGHGGEDFAEEVTQLITERFEAIQQDAFHSFRRTYLA